MLDGTYTFDFTKISDAHNACTNTMEKALSSPNIQYIIMDNTHTRLWHLLNSETIAKQYDVNIYYLDIVVPDAAHFSICLKRQRHNVPEDVLLDQWNNFEEHPTSMKIPMFVSEGEY
jgi:predicted kinase